MSTRWCCRILHEEFGPMDFEELRELAKSGTLSGGDLVRRETDDVWQAASKCAELRSEFASHQAGNVQETGSLRVASPRRKGSQTVIAGDEQQTARQFDPVSPAQQRANDDEEMLTTEPPRGVVLLITASLMLVLFALDRLIASRVATFPQPRRVREQLAAFYWFLGTGPWSRWEIWLLWLDWLVIAFFASHWIANRFNHKRY